MSSIAPIFPIPQPQHFSDYGFDPQIDYFQVLEEARTHKREYTSRSIDSIHFKLSKPISKEDQYHFSKKSNNSKRSEKRWWKNALLLFKWKWTPNNSNNNNNNNNSIFDNYVSDDNNVDVHQARARAFRASISGPVYITDHSFSGPTTPRRSSGIYSPGFIAGKNSPYVSLRKLNMEQRERVSTSAMPIYLVT